MGGMVGFRVGLRKAEENVKVVEILRETTELSKAR
jgi:hypothetical protein